MSDNESDYKDIIENTIDDLNQRGDFAGTVIEKDPLLSSAQKKVNFNNPILVGLFFLALASSGSFFYFSSNTKKGAVSAEEASIEARQLIETARLEKDQNVAKRAVIEFVDFLVDTPLKKTTKSSVNRALEQLVDDLESAGAPKDVIESVKETSAQ